MTGAIYLLRRAAFRSDGFIYFAGADEGLALGNEDCGDDIVAAKR